MPHGCVLAVFGQIEIYVISASFIHKHITTDPRLKDELSFGDWSDNRYAIKLMGRRELTQPIPARGRQGIWTWQPPEELLTLFR